MPSQVLTKGANVSLTKLMPTASEITIGFSWKVIESAGFKTEVVPCAIACGQDGKAVSPEHVAFFNQLEAAEGSVQYQSDGTLSGGDDEQIDINLKSIPSNITTIAFVLYVNPDLRDPGTLESMRSGAVRVLDRAGNEVLRYDVTSSDTTGVSALMVAELYLRNGEWKFRAVGQGYTNGVKDVAEHYGYDK